MIVQTDSIHRLTQAYISNMYMYIKKERLQPPKNVLQTKAAATTVWYLGKPSRKRCPNLHTALLDIYVHFQKENPKFRQERNRKKARSTDVDGGGLVVGLAAAAGAGAAAAAAAVPAKDHAESDRAGTRLTTDAVDGLEVVGVCIDDLGSAVGDGRAARAVLLADLHALDGLVSGLSLDGRDVPAGVATVDGAAKVELAPGARVPAVLVLGQRVAGRGTPGTLGVLVESDVLVLTGPDGEGQGRVAVPARHLAVGADLVPEGHGPLLAVGRGLEVHDVFVVVLLGFGDLDDVAAPWVTDVSTVADAAARGRGAAAEALPSELAIVGASGRSRRSRGGARRDDDRGARAAIFSGGGSGSRSRTAVVRVLPGDVFTIDLGGDPVADRTLLDGLLLALLVDLHVATLVGVHAAHGGAGAQGREEEKGVLELHFGGVFRFLTGRALCAVPKRSRRWILPRTAGKPKECECVAKE